MLSNTHKNGHWIESQGRMQDRAAKPAPCGRKRTAELKVAHDEIQKTNSSLTELLATMVELQEGEEKGFCRHLADIACMVGEKMQLPHTDVEDLRIACLLHSIGKMGMPKTLIDKPYQLLSPQEKSIFHKYPLIGEAALLAFEPLKHVADIISRHREYVDGSGFPYQMADLNIPITAKILALVLDYELLKKGALLKEPLLAQAALEYLGSQTKSRYDLAIYEVFKEVIDELPEEQSQLDEQVLPLTQLEPEMILSRDLATSAGILLLPKDTVLTEALIEKLQKLDDVVAYIKNN